MHSSVCCGNLHKWYVTSTKLCYNFCKIFATILVWKVRTVQLWDFFFVKLNDTYLVTANWTKHRTKEPDPFCDVCRIFNIRVLQKLPVLVFCISKCTIWPLLKSNLVHPNPSYQSHELWITISEFLPHIIWQ